MGQNKACREQCGKGKSLMLNQGSVVPGIYQHYKGQRYEVIDIAKHTETEEDFVVYRALYGEYGLWVRPLSMFVESVTVDGETVPRFRLERPFGY